MARLVSNLFEAFASSGDASKGVNKFVLNYAERNALTLVEQIWNWNPFVIFDAVHFARPSVRMDPTTHHEHALSEINCAEVYFGLVHGLALDKVQTCKAE